MQDKHVVVDHLINNLYVFLIVFLSLTFYLVQLLDGFKTTTDNVNGLMIKYITDAGFKNVQEVDYINTSIGTYSYYKAEKIN